MKADEVFQKTAAEIDGAVPGNLFGKPCYKTGQKAFVCLFGEELVFKLDEGLRTEALGLEGAKLFDPSGKGRPMKEWVQIPLAHQHLFVKYGKAAADYVSHG